MILRAVFVAPKGCNSEQFEKVFKENGIKFVEAMERQGYELKSDLDFYMDLPLSNGDPNQNHYVIRGHFNPRFLEEQNWVFEVPDRIVPKLLKKLGRKIKVL